MLFLAVISFLTRSVYGEFEWILTWHNYKRLAGFGPFGFEFSYVLVLGRTLALALAATAICAAAALPVAYGIARLPPRLKHPALVLLVVPCWTNLLIRTYAWEILLSSQSPISRFLARSHLISPGQALYPGMGAVMVALVCDYLPFMILPVCSAMANIDWSVSDAARDLGANPWKTFWHAVFPQIIPGVKAGSLLVFLPALGQFVIPDLLGGAKTALLGNLIQQQFGQSRDWPFGAALTGATLLVVLLLRPFLKREERDA